MKKTFLTIIIGLTTLNLFSTQPPVNFVYEEVVEIPNVSKDDLYQRATSCMVSMFNDSKQVVKIQDKEAGKIVAKGFIDGTYRQLSTTIEHGFEFELAIYVKEGRYKYIVSNISHIGCTNPRFTYPKAGGLLSNGEPDCGYGMSKMMKRDWKKYKEFAHAEVEKIVSIVKIQMNKQSETEADW